MSLAGTDDFLALVDPHAPRVAAREGAGRRRDLVGLIATAKKRLKLAELERDRVHAEHRAAREKANELDAELGRLEFTVGLGRRAKNKLEIELAGIICAENADPAAE